MRTENKGGDVLASGGTRCQFRAAGYRVTAEQWAAIWAEEPVVEQKKDADEKKEKTKDKRSYDKNLG